MSALSEHDTRFVERVARWQRPLAGLGAVLSLLGASYLAWAIVRYDPRADPRQNPGFDRPVAQLGFLFDTHQKGLELREPETRNEARLQRGLMRNMRFSSGVMVLLLRIFLGTLALVFGFAIMTVVVERGRLLAVIGRMRE